MNLLLRLKILSCSLLVLLASCNSKEEQEKQKPAVLQGGAFRVETDEEPAVEYSLTDEQTAYLWKMEHHGNILGKHGFGPLNQAIVAGDREAILRIIGEPVCTILDIAPQQITYQSEALTASRTTDDSDNQRVTIDEQEFVDWLLEKRAMFADSPTPQSKFYVKKILPPNEDEYWFVKCIHRMWGTSKQGGPLEINLHLSIKTHEIEKSRLDLGSWLHQCDVHQIDISEAPGPLFAQTDPKATSIFPDTFYDNWNQPRAEINTGGVYACDYNRDGLTDLFITDLRDDGGRMYTGKPDGKFVDQTFFLGLERAKNARIVAFVDLDGDGWEDIFLPDSSRIFRNMKGEKFVEYTAASNLPLMIDLAKGDRKRISGVIPADYDLDGDLDLYITRSVQSVGSWLESVQPHLAHNQLLRNDGDWKFKDVTANTRTDGEGRSTFSAVWTDVNNDRYPDLYMINEFGNGSLLLNQEGKTFERRLLMPNQADFGSMGLTCGDYDNDGNIDIYVSNMYSKAGNRVMGNMIEGTYPDKIQSRLESMVAGGELYQNQGDLTFKPVGKKFQVHAAGWAWGASLADLNNDGWLDLYVTAGFISRDRHKPDG